MPRRKKQHQPLAYAMLPREAYEGLAQGLLGHAEFAVWATIRLYCRDEERGRFSPRPSDLTNREISRIVGLNSRSVTRVLNQLESKGWIVRLSDEETAALGLEGQRWIRLCFPEGVLRVTVLPVTVTLANSTSSTREDKVLEDLELAASSGSALEGGVGGTGKDVRDDTVTHDSVTHDSVTDVTPIALRLQELEVWRKPAFAIAEQMLQEDATRTPEWAADTFYRVFNQERAVEKADPKTALRRTVARLKKGDWGKGLEAVLAEAERRQPGATHKSYATAYALGSALPPAPEPTPAERLWESTLRQLEGQMTRATFDAHLRSSRAVGFNSDGNTLVVRALNLQAVEWLEGRLRPVVQRTLNHNVDYMRQQGLDLPAGAIAVRFTAD